MQVEVDDVVQVVEKLYNPTIYFPSARFTMLILLSIKGDYSLVSIYNLFSV